MDVDEDEEDSHLSKKVKLSKEERKALKKAKKEQAKAEGGEVGLCLSLQFLLLNVMSRGNHRKRKRRTKKRKRRRKRRRKAEPSQCSFPSRFVVLSVSPCFRFHYFFPYFNSKGFHCTAVSRLSLSAGERPGIISDWSRHRRPRSIGWTLKLTTRHQHPDLLNYASSSSSCARNIKRSITAWYSITSCWFRYEGISQGQDSPLQAVLVLERPVICKADASLMVSWSFLYRASTIF